MQAKADIPSDEKSSKKKIIVTELPYQVNKARLIEKIAELVRDKKLDGISELRDEYSKTTIGSDAKAKLNVANFIMIKKMKTLKNLNFFI